MTYKELEHTYSQTSPEQFTSFMHTVKKARNAGGLTLFGISNMLCRIADSEIEECRSIGSKGNAMDADERQRLVMSSKVLACSLVLLCESRSRKEARIRSLLFLEYSSYLYSRKYDLTEVMMNCGCYAMTTPGFTWSMIETSIGTDMLVFKMLGHARFDKSQKLEEVSMDGAGSLSLKNGILHISSAQSRDSDVIAFSNHNRTIEVCTRNIREERPAAWHS